MSDLKTPLLLAGVACIVAAVVGGGIKLLGGEFPLLTSVWRQVLLAATGAILIISSLTIPSAADVQRAEDRAALGTSFSQRLEDVTTDLNRVQSGQSPRDGFIVGNEIVPLTDIWTNLNSERPRLGEDLYNLLLKKAQLVLRLANEGRSQEFDQEYSNVNEELSRELAQQ